MSRHPTMGRLSRGQTKSVSSIACLAFVGVMGVAFWAGAVWIANTLITLLSQ